jgi:hypothetical protein
MIPMSMLRQFFQRYGQILILASVLISGFATNLNFISTGARGSDDNLLFYMSGLNIFHKTEVLALNNRAVKHFEQKGKTRPHAMKRLILHRDYLNEYTLPGIIHYGVSRIFKPLFDPIPSLYPMYLAQSITIGFVACFAFALSLLAGIFYFIKNSLFSWALAITVILYGIAFFLPLKDNSFAHLVLQNSFWDMVKNTIEMLLHPSTQFSPLSFPPRSNFTLLMIGVFALRWSNRYFLSYLLVIVLSFIHLSSSGMILALLFGMDVVLRPEIFRTPKIAIALLVGMTSFVLRESMFDSLIGTNALYFLIGGTIALCSVVFAVLKTSSLRNALLGDTSFYAVTQKWLLARGTIGADLILLILVWLAIAILTYGVISQLNTELFEPWFKAYNFWGRLAGRLLMVIAPAMLFGICLLTLGKLMAREGAFKHHSIIVVPGLLTFMLGILVWQGANTISATVMPRIASDLFKAEKHISKGPMPKLKAMGFSEAVLYYAISKTVDGRGRPLDRLLR